MGATETQMDRVYSEQEYSGAEIVPCGRYRQHRVYLHKIDQQNRCNLNGSLQSDISPYHGSHINSRSGWTSRIINA